MANASFEVLSDVKVHLKSTERKRQLEEFMGYTPMDLSSILTWNDIMPIVMKVEGLECVGDYHYDVRICGTGCDINGKYAVSSERKIESVLVSIFLLLDWLKEKNK